MDFGFTKEQNELRKKIRNFFLSELPQDFDRAGGNAMAEEGISFWMKLQKRAGKKGYLAPGWSKEVGGLGLGPIEQEIVREEEAYAGADWPCSSGLRIAGPAVHLFGTEEQKRKFLAPMARGEVVWNQAFTEPEAGSDEANVQLRAVENGDYYILNGQKMFIGAHFRPDYLYTLARTEDTTPKHRGLSLFLVPTDTPGVTFRPLLCMGFALTHEIFFDDVRVPKENLLGKLNQGFYHAMTAFGFERGGASFAGRSKGELEEFVQFCKEEKRNGKPLIKDPEIRRIVARRAVELEVMRLNGWFTTWWSSKREKLGPQPPTLPVRFYLKTFAERWAKETIDILGLYGHLQKGSKWAKLAGQMERQWQLVRSMHGGGTVEIYKVTAAERGLGLPRAPRPSKLPTAKA